MYISAVCVFVTELLQNSWTDFNQIFRVSSGGFETGLDSQFSLRENVNLIDFLSINCC